MYTKLLYKILLSLYAADVLHYSITGGPTPTPAILRFLPPSCGFHVEAPHSVFNILYPAVTTVFQALYLGIGLNRLRKEFPSVLSTKPSPLRTVLVRDGIGYFFL
ncbi:hypothetical protein M422DRAFT_269418 [Sphaerobolus stellatus SS14]|uniref:Polyprenol reductase n=1 Tax=Sphaerobolus stellatus (strain SS14) TaxID=990650 RepID=A0A0C9TI80_SPHS4|nr:hypothetical protein M422DRAFT_269418 [Sphaerobolus stellatus SS14]